MHRAYKYRLYPTKEQGRQLNQSFAAVRWVYNAALEQRNTYGRAQGTDFFGRNSEFNAIRQIKEIHYRPRSSSGGIQYDYDLSWISNTPFDCLVKALRDLDQAFKRFFDSRKIGTSEGYPSFRSVEDNNSISFRAWIRSTVNGLPKVRPLVVFGQDCVTLPKFGCIKYKRHRKFYGDPKTVEVVREGRAFYVILVTECVFKKIEHKGEAVGLELSVVLPVCLSNGEAIAPDPGLEVLEKKVRKAQKRLSRAIRGSKRSKKTKHRLADIKLKQVRRRTARTHVVTSELTRRFSYIAIEDLKLKETSSTAKDKVLGFYEQVKKNTGRTSAVPNVSMCEIRTQIDYKSEKTGTKIQSVSSKKTLQTCIVGGNKSFANRQKQASSGCINEACNYLELVYVNAAKNVLRRANPSAAVLGRRKSPSKSTAMGIIPQTPTSLATTKISGSCFQPISALALTMEVSHLTSTR